MCAPGALPRPLSCVRSAGGRIHYTHTHNSDAARDSIPRGCASAAERDVRACAPGRDSAGRADHRRCAVQRSSHYNCGAGGSAAQRRRSTGRGSAHHADARARAQAEAQRITRTRRRKRSASQRQRRQHCAAVPARVVSTHTRLAGRQCSFSSTASWQPPPPSLQTRTASAGAASAACFLRCRCGWGRDGHQED